MTTPSCLPSSDPSITVDATDMHTYGMTVKSVVNPVPPARPSYIEIPGRHGGFDFAKRYMPRTMTLTGAIIGDTHAQFLANVDGVQEFFRLRENADEIIIIFQDATTRRWRVRFESLEIRYLGSWKETRVAEYTLVLRCIVPWAEKTTVTTVSRMMSISQLYELDYAGTVATPVSFLLKAKQRKNILEQVAGDCNEDNTLWTFSNASGSDSTSSPFYGTNKVVVARTAAGAYYAEVDVTAQISTSSNYVFGVWTSGGTVTRLRVILTGGTSTDQGIATAGFGFKIVTAAMLSGVTTVKLQVYNDGTDASFAADGGFIYEITAAQAADSDFIPMPYYSDPSGDDYVPPKNPVVAVHNSINLFPTENGVLTGWGGGTSRAARVSDPLGGADKCICWMPNDTLFLYSPAVYVYTSQRLELSVKYFAPIKPGILQILVLTYSETGVLLDTDTIEPSASSPSSWTTFNHVATNTYGQGYVKVAFYAATGWVSSIVYIKDLQLEADPDTGYSSYAKPRKSQIAWTGTLDADDQLLIDSERMLFNHVDISAGTAASAAANILGSRLMIEPGNNIIIYSDARVGHEAPETESCGWVDAEISYRERYL